MKRSILFILCLTALSVLLIACDPDDSMVAPMQADNSGQEAAQHLAKVNKGMIWADGTVYGTIGTPATFKPESGPFDELYVSSGFLSGIGAISEAKPGDHDYNGGRWHVNALKETIDPAKYAGASSVEELDTADFEATDTYFECPLLPRRN